MIKQGWKPNLHVLSKAGLLLSLAFFSVCLSLLPFQCTLILLQSTSTLLFFVWIRLATYGTASSLSARVHEAQRRMEYKGVPPSEDSLLQMAAEAECNGAFKESELLQRVKRKTRGNLAVPFDARIRGNENETEEETIGDVARGTVLIGDGIRRAASNLEATSSHPEAASEGQGEEARQEEALKQRFDEG